MLFFEISFQRGRLEWPTNFYRVAYHQAAPCNTFSERRPDLLTDCCGSNSLSSHRVTANGSSPKELLIAKGKQKLST